MFRFFFQLKENIYLYVQEISRAKNTARDKAEIHLQFSTIDFKYMIFNKDSQISDFLSYTMCLQFQSTSRTAFVHYENSFELRNFDFDILNKMIIFIKINFYKLIYINKIK